MHVRRTIVLGLLIGLLLWAWTIDDSPTSSSVRERTIVSGVVVPHHDLVKAKRAELFAELQAKRPSANTIVLVSPNHYESGRGTIQTTIESWELAGGRIEPAMSVIDALVTSGVATAEPGSFVNEHGIRSLLADLEYTYPTAQLVPLILKSSADADDVLALHEALVDTCSSCLMVASVDFSHYQPALLADVHDQLSRRALELLDEQLLLRRAEVDSPASLALLARWAKSQGTERFAEFAHTNSGVLVGDPEIETTTHVFGWYELGDRIVPTPGVTFSVGGDMMFDRSVAHATVFSGKPYRSILEQLGDRLFWGTDLGLANLEGPISAVPVEDNVEPNNLVFNFPPEAVAALQYLRLNGVSLGNNHTNNAGSAGLETTRRLLDEAGIAAVSGPGVEDVARTISVTGAGLTLHVIAPHVLAGVTDITEQITALAADQANRILILPHWGAEYQLTHAPSQQRLARAWIDAGADAVIGSHPHVVQDAELYNGRPIIYSLGNLIFDQMFSVETQRGLVVAGEFTGSELRLVFVPTVSERMVPRLARGTERARRLAALLAPFGTHVQHTSAGSLVVLPVTE